MMVSLTSSVGLARQSENSDTNFYAVTCEVLVKAIDDDQAIDQVREAIMKAGLGFRWEQAHIIPKGIA